MMPAGQLVEATTHVHRDYVRTRSRETPFVRTVEEDASIRTLDAAYRAWAHARNLDARPGEHRFAGRFWGRNITFFTGLSGTAPIAAEVMIEAMLPIEHCTLIERQSSSDHDKTQERTLGLVLTIFGSAPGPYVRSVGVTPRGLRVRLEPLIPPADVDALLDVLLELVSSIASLAVPCSSHESITLPGPPQ
jgi:hypothetical protein